MTATRALVVEDSTTMRRYLRGVLDAEPGIDVVGEAADGQDAIHLCQTLRPDVVTMDMMLPVMDGLGATEYIMAHCPTPILIVSSSMNRGEVFKTCQALAAGAVDVLEKPTGTEAAGTWERRFVAAVKLVSRIRTVTHLRARLAPPGRPSSGASRTALAGPPQGIPYQIAAIGASTGGAGAIVRVLRDLPRGLPLPIVFVLHITEPFGAAFAEWLDDQTGFPCAYACDGELVAAATGRVTMAPGGRHLIVRGGRFHLTADPERHFCRPSVDVLFESIAREYGSSAMACLLTGMGRDGAAGLLEIRKAGGRTIAQDEETSAVYGMPREAALLDAAERVLPLADIGPVLAGLVECTWNKERHE